MQDQSQPEDCDYSFCSHDHDPLCVAAAVAREIAVFNTLGQQVSRLVKDEVAAGYHDVAFGTSDIPGESSGVTERANILRAAQNLLHLPAFRQLIHQLIQIPDLPG